MAVMPVSSVSYNGSFNAVNFQGKNKRNVTNPDRSIPLRRVSVPVAVLMAMSPLTTANVNAEGFVKANNNIELYNPEKVTQEVNQRVPILDKTFDIKGEDGLKMRLLAISNDKNNGNFEDVFVFPTRNGKEFAPEKVVGVENVKIYLNSDNGVKEGPITFKQVITKNNYGFTSSIVSPDFCNYVEALSKHAGNNNAITSKNYTTNLILDDNFIFKMGTPKNSILEAPADVDFGEKLNEMNIKGSHGNYKFRIYSKDNKKVVTIQKEGQPEVEYVKTGFARTKINPFYGEIGTCDVNIIITKNGNFTDDVLGLCIQGLAKKPEYEFLSNSTYLGRMNYVTNSDGYIVLDE